MMTAMTTIPSTMILIDYLFVSFDRFEIDLPAGHIVETIAISCPEKYHNCVKQFTPFFLIIDSFHYTLWNIYGVVCVSMCERFACCTQCICFISFYEYFYLDDAVTLGFCRSFLLIL